MTRLVREDIFEIEKNMKAYDRTFREQTGFTMQEIAMRAAGFHRDPVPADVAVVSVTSGLGVISGFADTVAAILRYYGIRADVMAAADVEGLQQAYRGGYGLVYLADDAVFTALGLGSRVVSDNGEATGLGFAAALTAAIGHRGQQVRGQRVLVLGAGPVGKAACRFFLSQGMRTELYDKDGKARQRAKESIRKLVCLDEEPEYRSYEYLLDATTASGLIGAEDVSERTIIAAPGMPCGVTPRARSTAVVIHNPLELGVLTMYYQCMAQLAWGRNGEKNGTAV